MLRQFGLLALTALAVGSTPALAQNPFPLPLPPLPMTQGTPEERAACLQKNRQRISAACRQVLANRGM